MILIQVLLIIAFTLLLAKFLVNSNTSQISAWKKIVGSLLVLFAIVAILLPDTLNRLARFVGVGRGADLLLYVLALSFIFVLFNSYVNSKQEQQRFVRLARKVAIIGAEIEQQNSTSKRR